MERELTEVKNQSNYQNVAQHETSSLSDQAMFPAVPIQLSASTETEPESTNGREEQNLKKPNNQSVDASHYSGEATESFLNYSNSAIPAFSGAIQAKQQTTHGTSFTAPVFQLKAYSEPISVQRSASGYFNSNPMPIQKKDDDENEIGKPNDGGQQSDSKNSDNDVFSQMESAMNADFSNVKIHSGSHNAVNVGAQAFTQGNDIHFAPGKFDTNSPAGKELLAHELVHVKQQGEGRVQANNKIDGIPLNDDKKLEDEADEIASKVTR